MKFKKFFKSLIAITLVISMITSSISYAAVEAKAKNDVSRTFTGEGFSVKFSIDSQWSGAFNGSIKITNTGNKAIENWSLMFYMDNNITNIWNATIQSNTDGLYCIKNSGWNQNIPVGKSAEFGFTATAGDVIYIPTSYYIPTNDIQVQDVPTSDYDVDFIVDSDWNSGFTGRIIIKNLSQRPIKDWTLEFDFDKNIQSIWNATIISHTGNHYIIKNNTYNMNIEAGSSISFGFNGASGNVKGEPVNYKMTQKVDVIDCSNIDTDGDGGSAIIN